MSYFVVRLSQHLLAALALIEVHSIYMGQVVWGYQEAVLLYSNIRTLYSIYMQLYKITQTSWGLNSIFKFTF